MRQLALLSTIVALQLFFGSGTHAQLKYARVDTLTDALKYLVQFGYLKNLNEVVSLLQPSFTSFDPRNPAVSAMKIAFTKFQQYAKLPVSGEFDAATKKKMNTGRCGNKDIIQIDGEENLGLGNLLRKRKKRYVAGAFQWQKRELTYRISKFSETDFSPEVTMREVDKAFELWGNVTNLHFVKSQGGGVDIELKFAKSVHGDIEPFDGRGITLAHAFPPGPEIGGDIHFDDDEEWTSGEDQGTNFMHVVVHELGHALGLRHSDIEEAIMYAFARPYEPNLQLHEDDVEGIQSMYGARNQQTTTTTEPSLRSSTSEIIQTQTETEATESSTTPMVPDNTVKPDLCQDSKIDAITTLGDGSVYVFKGNYAFRIDPNGGGVQSSDLISYVFYSAVGPIDAALTFEGKTFLFKGDKYWRFINRKLDGTFPRLISQDFPGIPNNLDAAFTWSADNHIYFFKSDKYWAFDPTSNPPVGKSYPLPISQWYGLPTKNLDAVFTSPSGPTYFFQADNYWLFDDDNFQVAETDPPYPQSSRVMWFKCTAYRPEAGELKRGFIRKAVDAVSNVFKGVVGHVDYKLKKITGWLG